MRWLPGPGNHLPRDRPFRIILTSWRNFNIVFFLATVHRIRRDQQHYSFRMMNEAYSATGGGSGQSVPSKNSFQTRRIRANETNQVGFESTIRETPGARIRWNITYLRFRYQLSSRRRVETFGPIIHPKRGSKVQGSDTESKKEIHRARCHKN